jgi:methionyl-tRNA synthetase
MMEDTKIKDLNTSLMEIMREVKEFFVKNQATASKFLEIVRDLRSFIAEKKVGNIQINMFKGGISNWSINETKK